MYVLFAQFNNFLELSIPKIPGAFSLVKRLIAIFQNVFAGNVNLPTFICSVVACLLLYYLKEINLWYKKKYDSTRVWPVELVLVILGVIFGYLFDVKNNFDIGIVGVVPQGFPPLIVDKMVEISDIELIKKLLPDAFSIVMVSYSVGLSMGELFAFKYNYDLDANAEAHGLAFAFFGCSLIGGVSTGPALAPWCFEISGDGWQFEFEESSSVKILAKSDPTFRDISKPHDPDPWSNPNPAAQPNWSPWSVPSFS